MTAATIAEVLSGARAPHELTPLEFDLWRDGFRCGQNAADARVARLERECDDLYFRLHNPAEVVAERDKWLRHFDVVQRRRKSDARRREEAAHG